MTDELEIDPRIRKIIWRGLGKKTIREMAEETGLSPDQVFSLKRDMLSAVDVLTVQEKRHKLLVDLEDIADKVREDYDAAPFEFKAGMMNSGISAMKAVLTELNRAEKGEQEAIDRLNALRVKELLRLIDVSVNRTLADIAERYDLEANDLHDIFQSHLRPAAEELEAE